MDAAAEFWLRPSDPKNDAMAGPARVEESLGCPEEPSAVSPVRSEARPTIGRATITRACSISAARAREALQAFRKMAELATDPAPALAYIGAALDQLRRTDEAAAAYRRSIELRPTMAAHSNLGLLLRSQGRLEEAASEFEKAAALQPGDFRLWKNVAETCGCPDGRRGPRTAAPSAGAPNSR
jgi:Flp pilus assembly protein TadD